MLFQKNLTRSGNALIFEHGEESVQGLVIGHCHHLLFLPAAGLHVNKDGSREFRGSNTAYYSCSFVLSPVGPIYDSGDTFVGAGSKFGASSFRAIRLASVVSEDLTEVWKKCQSVVILWPPCHSERSEESVVALLVRLHLLFLPAAGMWWINNGLFSFSGELAYRHVNRGYLCHVNSQFNVCRTLVSDDASRRAVRLARVVSEGLTRQGNASYIFRP